MGKSSIRIWMMSAMLLLAHQVWSQSLSTLEYWFDSDVAARKTRAISGKEAKVSFAVSTDGLTSGFHQLFLRVKDSDGIYSGTSSSFFIKGITADCNRIEYWFDDNCQGRSYQDIGAFDGTKSFDITLDLSDVAKFPVGFHRLYYRFVTAKGVTPVNVAYLVNTGKSSEPGRLEYWIDDRIADSRFVECQLQEDGTYSSAAVMDLSEMEVGFHRLYYRISSKGGQNYSAVSVAHVFVAGGEAPQISYWFDNNINNVRAIAAESYGNVHVVDDSLDVSDLSQGVHMLNYRITSPNNRYGSCIHKTPIVVMPLTDFFNRQNETTIVSGIYWVDDQPARTFENFKSGEVVDLEEILNLADLTDGEHLFSMRFVDSNGKWTDVDKTVFVKQQFEDTQIIAGILYKYYEYADEPYVAAIGYEEDIKSADILSAVRFGAKNYDVISIDENAFNGCSTIGEVVNLPSSVKSIGSKAFAASSVSEVNLDAAEAPVMGENIWPQGTNLRVPVGASGYDAMSRKFEAENIILTYDLGCIYDSQWAALKRIDSMLRDKGYETGWDFSDRRSTPVGVYRWGTDNVYEIDLSNHGIGDEYQSKQWTDGLPRVSRIDLSGNSITDMVGQEGYGVLRLDSQTYNAIVEVHLDEPDHEFLLNPEVPLIFRDASSGSIGDYSNHTVTYRLSTKTPDNVYIGEWQKDYEMLLSVASDGTIRMTLPYSITSNVYKQKSGQVLAVTSSGIRSITPGSFFRMRLYFADGDADLNGMIDVTDLQIIINHIFSTGSSSRIFAWHAANLADDDVINVQDVVGMVEVLLNQSVEDIEQNGNAAKRRVLSEGVSPMIDAEEEESEAVISVSADGLTISSKTAVAALDLVLTQGADFSELGRLGMVISRRAMEGGLEHVIAYSMSDAVIPAGEHIIATKTSGRCVLAATLSDADANRISTAIEHQDEGATNITDIQTGEDSNIYDLNGRPVSRAYRGITIQKGKVRMSNISK